MNIMLCGAMLFGGWLWYYLFMRQFLFNVQTAIPLVKKMQALQDELITRFANRYTTISIIVCSVLSAIIIAVIIRFCPLYLIVSFFVGAVICAVMLINKLTPVNRDMFNNFCAAYCQFVTDEELRNAMYNKKPSQMKLRLHDMGLSTEFIPDFKD